MDGIATPFLLHTDKDDSQNDGDDEQEEASELEASLTTSSSLSLKLSLTDRRDDLLGSRHHLRFLHNDNHNGYDAEAKDETRRLQQEEDEETRQLGEGLGLLLDDPVEEDASSSRPVVNSGGGSGASTGTTTTIIGGGSSGSSNVHVNDAVPDTSVAIGRGAFSGHDHDDHQPDLSIVNLDRFLQNLYDYHQGHGVKVSCARFTSRIVLAAICIFLVALLGLAVHYDRLLDCGHLLLNGECHGVLEWPTTTRSFSVGNVVVLIVVLILTGYWIDLVRRLIGRCVAIQSCDHFYKHIVMASASKVTTPNVFAEQDWTEVEARLEQASTSGLLRGTINRRLTCGSIRARLTRHENFLLCLLLTKQNVLGFNIHYPVKWKARYLLGPSVLWGLYLCIINPIWNSAGTANRDFTQPRPLAIQRLQTHLRWTALLLFLLTPFALVYMVSSFIFGHLFSLEDANGGGSYKSSGLSSSSSLPSNSNYEWTAVGKWRMKSYNQLAHEHQLELDLIGTLIRRLYSMAPPNRILVECARITMFVCGLGFILSILSGTSNGHWFLRLVNVLLLPICWHCKRYVASSSSSSTTPSSSPAALSSIDHGNGVRPLSRDECYTLLCLLSPNKKRSFATAQKWKLIQENHKLISHLYEHVVIKWLQKVASFFLAPWYFGILLPRRANDILTFIESHSCLDTHADLICLDASLAAATPTESPSL